MPLMNRLVSDTRFAVVIGIAVTVTAAVSLTHVHQAETRVILTRVVGIVTQELACVIVIITFTVTLLRSGYDTAPLTGDIAEFIPLRVIATLGSSPEVTLF